MGFSNSVSIAQHVHRNVIKWSAMAGIGGENEMRKDPPLSSGSQLYRIYLDNFDLLERTESHLAERIKGGVADAVAQVREMYETMGLPRHPKKSVQRALRGEVQESKVQFWTVRQASPSPSLKRCRCIASLPMSCCREGNVH